MHANRILRRYYPKPDAKGGDALPDLQGERRRNTWATTTRQNSGAPATIGDEVGSLRFLLLENLLDYFEAILLRRCIPRLDRKRNLYQKPHALFLPPYKFK